ncbi:hypothetical protein V491_08020 [Pseudogymnoascus sp. VKM F-3775]|nr:hypothetical protein V491_08020 [Pseudogymnoascus sp. VKM F-3775]
MQDEWEIIEREERIRLEREETEINRQPVQQQQMRYSTSNLFEEVPEVFRPVAVSRHGNETTPRVSSPGLGEQETNVEEPLLQGIGHQEHRQNSNGGTSSHHKPRQSSHGPRKLAVRKSSPIGSASITGRSNSADLGGKSRDSRLPQRSATAPSRPSAQVSPVTYPSPNFLSYRSKGWETDGIPEMPGGFGMIKEEAKSEHFRSSIRSDVGVKSFTLGSIYSSSSLRHGDSDVRADESAIVYYGHEDRPQHHRLSDFPRSRPLTPEPNGLDDIGSRLESVDEDDVNVAECNSGLDIIQTETEQGHGLIGEQVNGEELFAQLSTPTPALRRFSISPSEMEDAHAPSVTLEATHLDDDVKPPRSLGRAESLIRYLVDVDKFLNISAGWTKDSSNTSIERPNYPSNDSFEVSRGSDAVEGDVAVDSMLQGTPEQEGVVVDNMPKGIFKLSDNVSNDVVEANNHVAEEYTAPETTYRLKHGESSVTDFADSTSKAVDSIADDWIELSSLETSPTSPGEALDKDLLSDDCDFVSAEQHMVAEMIGEGHMVLSLAPEIVSEDRGSSAQERCDVLQVETIVPSGEPTVETTTQPGELSTTKPLNTEVKDHDPEASTNLVNSTPQRMDKGNNLGMTRKSSKKSRNRRNRKRRAAAEAAKEK